MPMPSFIAGPIAAFAVIVLLFASVKILRQCERAVVFVSGKFQTVKGPRLDPNSGQA